MSTGFDCATWISHSGDMNSQSDEVHRDCLSRHFWEALDSELRSRCVDHQIVNLDNTFSVIKYLRGQVRTLKIRQNFIPNYPFGSLYMRFSVVVTGASQLRECVLIFHVLAWKQNNQVGSTVRDCTFSKSAWKGGTSCPMQGTCEVI